MVKSGITQAELIAWGGTEVFRQALALVNSGAVAHVAYNDDTLEISGTIEQPNGWEMPVSLRLEKDNLMRSFCPCIVNQRDGKVCAHVIAVALAQMVLESEAPLADAPPPGKKALPPAQEPDGPRPSEPSDATTEVPLRPRFYAYVAGSRASLAVELDAWYGDIDFPACSLQDARTVYLPDPDDPCVRRVRSLDAEKEAVASLLTFGFEPGYRTGDVKYYLTDPHKVLNFLGTGLPALRRRPAWHVDLADRLGRFVDSLPVVAPLVQVRDVPGGAFDVSYAFSAFSEGRPPVTLSPAEVQAAVNRGDGYIRSGERLTLLDSSAVTAMHAVFRDCAATQDGAPRGWFRVRGVHAPYVKASLEALGSVEIDDSRAKAWRETADARNRIRGEARFEPIALGPLDGTLRPYQKQGVYWMRFLEDAGLSGLLADEMGLGKTLQTLAWLSLPRTERSEGRLPAVIVCPTSLVRNWEAEAAKFTPKLKVLVVSGPDRARAFAEIPKADLVITSYALLQRDFEAAYRGRAFSAAVLDEAQHIKNRQTRNARAAKQLDARQRLVLTGTPVENSVADVWSIFDFLMPGYLGDYESFRLAYETPIQEGGAAAAEAQARLHRKLHPFILRRLKQTVAKDLPDKLVKVSYCTMPDDVQRDYAATLQKERGGAQTKFQMLALLTKLRQIASRGKVEAFMDLLDEAIDGGHRVLVFSQFVRQLTALRQALDRADVPYCYLDGSTQDRLGECTRFNRTPSIPVFLISLLAGGTGLNLTGADMVVHYDPWWNPAVEDQATDRAHRLGQKKQVYVVKLIASGSVEEKVLALQRRKQAVIAATVSTSDTAIVERLTQADLAELLA